jgi:trigger factor
VKEIYQIELPEINDDFAQSMGPFKNIIELKEKVKENILKEKEARENEKTEIQILEKLIEKSKFEEIPDVLINHEIEKMMAELKNNVENVGPKIGAGAKFEDYLKAIKKTQEDLKKDFIPKAEQRIKTALLIREIAEKEKIEASEEEVESELKKLKQLYQGQDRALENLNSENGKIYIKNLVANEKVIKWLKEKLI